MPPPVGLPLRLSVGGCWLCFFLMLCVVCVVFIGLVTQPKHLRFAVSLVLALTHDANANHMGYGKDINHSAQQANHLANLALTGLMNLAANLRSTLNTEPDAQPHTTTNMTNKDTPSGCESYNHIENWWQPALQKKTWWQQKIRAALPCIHSYIQFLSSCLLCSLHSLFYLSIGWCFNWFSQSLYLYLTIYPSTYSCVCLFY